MLENINNLQARSFDAAMNPCAAGEDRAWALLYAAVGQASTAKEVVEHLDADLTAKRAHLALYIRAKTTLREHKVATARNQRIGAFVREVLKLVLIGPFRMLRSVGMTGARIAMEALSHTGRGSRPARATALARHPDFTFAKDRMTLGADNSGLPDTTAELRDAKAA